MTEIDYALDKDDLAQLHQEFVNTPKSDVLSRIITQNGINQAAEDPNAAVRLNPVFSCLLYTSPSPRDTR